VGEETASTRSYGPSTSGTKLVADELIPRRDAVVTPLPFGADCTLHENERFAPVLPEPSADAIWATYTSPAVAIARQGPAGASAVESLEASPCAASGVPASVAVPPLTEKSPRMLLHPKQTTQKKQARQAREGALAPKTLRIPTERSTKDAPS
jgi:hypothetical protein